MRSVVIFLFGLFFGVGGAVTYTILFPSDLKASKNIINYPELVFGRDDAPITIIEYSSVGCGLCGAFKKRDWPHVKEKYVDTGRVKWTLRHYPLSHADLKAGMFAMCHENSAALFDNYFNQQERWLFAEDPLGEVKKIALESGMSPEKLAQCEEDEDLLNRFIALRLHAKSTYDLVGTPAFVVGKNIIPGYAPKEIWDKVIAQAEDHIQNGSNIDLFELDLPDKDEDKIDATKKTESKG